MIESVISRLSGHSATVKNFCLTVSAGAFALAVTNSETQLLWIAVIAPALFGLLDAYYLAIERAFRDFYRTVADRPLSEARNVAMEQEGASLHKALLSFTVWPFYVPQSVVGLLVIWKGL